MIRRALPLAFMMLVVWASPAAAQQDYRQILGEGQRTVTVQGVAPSGFSTEATTGTDLARTGSDLVPATEAGIVLLGGGALLTLVARRRRAQRRITGASWGEVDRG